MLPQKKSASLSVPKRSPEYLFGKRCVSPVFPCPFFQYSISVWSSSLVVHPKKSLCL